MKIARDKFKLRDTVRLTPRGNEQLAGMGHGLDTRGTVVGYGRDQQSVRVLREGHVSPDRYHMDFWEVVDADREIEQIVTLVERLPTLARAKLLTEELPTRWCMHCGVDDPRCRCWDDS